jgi:CRISPR-associated endonuclease/helicase Cas3
MEGTGILKPPPLSAEDFPAFFRATNGNPPFRWQTRLALEVVSGGGWPDQISLPTAAGKTSLIDIAIFALACEAPLPPRERTAALRIFFVIDRRVVVDTAYLHSKEIGSRLKSALGDRKTPAILRAVAQRLQHLAGERNDPLFSSIMRGGMLLDTSWTRSATQPTVCVSTVDQLGSRLLFRGYGVSRNQRPIHAALAGCDSLIIVDEAHLSVPFCETLGGLKRYAKRAEQSIAKTLSVVAMTATPLKKKHSFRLEPEDFPEPVLERRLNAFKPTTLKSVADAENSKPLTALVNEVCQLAKGFKDSEPKVVGIVVNRVLTARRIFERLDIRQRTRCC